MFCSPRRKIKKDFTNFTLYLDASAFSRFYVLNLLDVYGIVGDN